MNERALVALSWVVPAVLAVAGAYFALIYEPRLEPDRSPGSDAVVRGRPIGEIPRAPDFVRDLRREQEISEARELEPTPAGEDAPRARDLRHLARERAEAEPLARRFFAAFARYELGVLDRSTKVDLRETATASFARALIAAPPRVPAGRERPPVAELGGLDFVAGATQGGRVRTGELVGWVERAGVRSPLAIEFKRDRSGWRVAGIGQ